MYQRGKTSTKRIAALIWWVISQWQIQELVAVGDTEGELQVLVNLSKVFQIVYCDFFELSKAQAWKQICADFVPSVRYFMPEMLRKQKVEYISHLVQCMQDFRPSSSFCTERFRIYLGISRLLSRDIAAHFSVIEYLHFVCEGGCYNDQMESCDKGLHDLYYSNEVQRFLNSTASKDLTARKAIYTAATARMPSGVCDQFMFVKVNITELGVESTIEQLLHMDPPFNVNLHLSCLLDGKVQQFKAVMSYVLELVHTGDYIELQPPFCESQNPEQTSPKGDQTAVKSHETKTRLPKITLKKFNDIDKFNYLRSLLEHSVLEAISGLTLSSVIYEEAVAILKKRFGNKQNQIIKHMKALLGLEAVTSPRDLKNLRQLYDAVE
eukprot:Em0004g642a